MMEWIVTSSAMILIVIALRGLLKGKISLKLQYGLWALVLIRLLLPFSIVESAISISNVLSAPVIREADDAVADYESAYLNAVQRYEETGTGYSDLDIRQQVQQELFDRTYEKIEREYAQTGAVVPEVQIQTEAQQQVEVISLTAVITEALPYLWMVGMIVVAAALIGSNLHFGWKLYKSRKALDIPGVPLKVYLTDYVATPCLFGLGRPDIYLTQEVMTDSKTRSHVIAHEMSHYRQGDHIWSLLRCVCLVLHWYNPLVWAAAILSKQDAELACDEATIRVLGEAERVAYGRTLIGMTCVRRDPRSLMLTATTMLGTKKTLKERISLIAKKPKTALYTLIACVLVAAIAVGCTFTGAPAQTEEEILLDRCREAVEYIQNLEHFEITEHYEVVEESDYVLGPNSVEARYVHSGDNWYHTRITVDWTWRFLEKDGEQFRKDITKAVPEEDIPAIEWLPQDLTTNLHAKHAWIMDIHWDDETIEFLTYTGNGDGYEGGSLTPVSVTSDTDGDADLIRVEFEIGTERIVNDTDAEGRIWIFTFRLNRETGIVTEVTREIVMEDSEMNVNGETVKANFHSTSTLTITPGTEEEMSAIIDDIYYGEIVTVVPTPDGPTEPTTEPTEPPTEPTVTLTEEERFQEMLRSDYWYWRIAGCVFDNPVDIDMKMMFYTGMEEHMDWDDLTEAEQEFLLNLPNSATGGEFFGDPDRLPAEEMNAVLQEYLGITLSDVVIPTNWDYFDQTDAYYRSGTDSYGAGINVTEVQQDGALVYVYYTSSTPIDDPQGQGSFNEPQMVMTLEEKSDSGYYIRSNQVVQASKYDLSAFSLDQEPYYYPFTDQEIADARVLADDYLDSIVHSPDALRYFKVNSVEFDPALTEAYEARLYGYGDFDPALVYGDYILFTVEYEYSRVDAYGNAVLDRDIGYVCCYRASVNSDWWVSDFGLTTDTIPQRLPENFIVEDLVTIMEYGLAYYDGIGSENIVTAFLPEIFPFSQDAIDVQRAVDEFTIDGNTMTVDSYATLTDGILSVVIRETTYFDLEYYTIYNFDIATGDLMATTDMVSAALDDVSYVRFLAASHQYSVEETRNIFEERETQYRENNQLEFYQMLLNEMETDTVRMFHYDLSYTEEGLCLYYLKNTLSGASNYPTLLPLSTGSPDWDAWSEAEAYDWFFNLEVSDEDTDGKDAYSALLLRALFTDTDVFVKYLNDCSADKMDEISLLVDYAMEGSNHSLHGLLSDLTESKAKTALLQHENW